MEVGPAICLSEEARYRRKSDLRQGIGYYAWKPCVRLWHRNWYEDQNLALSKCIILPPIFAGAWALEAAEQLPASVEIHAVDLSNNNFPPSPPLNVHFLVASVTNLPKDWTESFDFVNQRLLFSALLREQWPEVLSEIFRVLKPGGAVQFVEMDLYHPVPETPVVSYYRDIHELGMDKAGLLGRVGTKLHGMLLDSGFVGVKSEAKHNPVGKMWGEIGIQGAKCYGGAFRKLADMFLKAGTVKTKEEYDELMDKLEHEWDEQGTQYHCMIVCARKPFV